MEKITVSVNALKTGIGNVKDNALVVGFFKDKVNLSGGLKKLDEGSSGIISSYIKDSNFKADKGESKTLYLNGKIKHLVLAGLGEEEKYNLEILLSTLGNLSRKLRDGSFESFSILLDSFTGKFKEEDIGEKIVQSVLLGTYRFSQYRTKNKEEMKYLKQVSIVTDSGNNFESSVKFGQIAADAARKTRELVNTPPNVATPEFVANYAKKMAAESGLKCTIFDERQIEKMKMECLYAVGKGSVNRPRMVILEYKGAGNQKPIAIVGKGITFDTGGINVKPHPYIINMKDDKGGAVAAIHIIEACSKLKMPINLVVVTPLAENMIDSAAYRPDDVLKAYNGITIEVKNTDAEGRLVLADGLAYAAEMKPQAIFDIASLTGAARVVLGNAGSPFMSNSEELTGRLKKASEKSLEKIWELPLWEEYDEDIKGDIADIKNIGNDGDAGTIIGGMFLKNFVNDLPWAHIDIGETVFSKSENGILTKGGTGASVRLMIEMLREWKNFQIL